MFIPWAIIAIIVIIGGVVLDDYKNKMESKHQEHISRIEQENSDRWQRDYEHYCKEIKSCEIQIISATFDCSVKEAEKKYDLLCATYNKTEFLLAESNSERKKIYSTAIKCSIEDSMFEDYIVQVLLPIVDANHYDLDISDMKRWQREFNSREDISIEEKVQQICNHKNNYHPNAAALLNCLNNIIIDTNNITDGNTINVFTNEELIKIAKSFNKTFDFNIDEDILEAIDYEEFCFDEDIKRNYDGLFSILTACIYFSEELDIYIDTYGLRLAVTELFLFFPYYKIKDWKIVIHDHIREVCEFRDISFKEIEE